MHEASGGILKLVKLVHRETNPVMRKEVSNKFTAQSRCRVSAANDYAHVYPASSFVPCAHVRDRNAENHNERGLRTGEGVRVHCSLKSVHLSPSASITAHNAGVATARVESSPRARRIFRSMTFAKGSI